MLGRGCRFQNSNSKPAISTGIWEVDIPFLSEKIMLEMKLGFFLFRGFEERIVITNEGWITLKVRKALRGIFLFFGLLEIMSDNIFINFKNGVESKLMSLNSSTKFIDLIHHVSLKWPLLDNIVLHFSVGDVSNCSLDDEEDFQNLITMCMLTSCKIVVVDVSQDDMRKRDRDEHLHFDCLDKDARYDVGHDSSARNKIPFRNVKKIVDFSQDSDIQGSGSMSFYDICPMLKKKPLLSDSWCHAFDGGVGTIFSGGAIEYRAELIKYAIHSGFRFRYKKNNKTLIYAVSRELDNCGCPWVIKAKLQTKTNCFEVTEAVLQHSCVGNLVGKQNSRLGAKILGNLFVENVKSDPTMSGKNIRKLLQSSYGLHLPYWKAWRSYQAAMSQVFGSFDDSYDQLRWYCDAIKRTNKGSVVSLESNSKTSCFERVFIAFKACLDGFKSCRPILFIDGTFMIGRAQETLLGATAKDGNNGLFPVAFAIVSAENTSNWMWFLEKLRDFVTHDKQICYISDRNTGLLSAFPKVFEKPLHFYCMYHLLGNLRGRFTKGWTNDQRKNLGTLFKDCVYAPNVRFFDEKVAIFKVADGKVADEWINDLPNEKWAVAYSMHIKRYGEMTSNAAEQFNRWIKDARSLPITHMIDHIRRDISQWIVDRREESQTWTGALCPLKENIWNYWRDISRSWTVQRCPSGKFEVLSSPSAEVDLKDKTCSCYQWQVRGFPCAHATVVIIRECPSVYAIVEECFFTKSYRKCYSYDIHAIPETERFKFQPTTQNAEKIQPPVLNRKPGRPKEKRKSSFGEWPKKKPTVACARCGNVANHDATTCYIEPEEMMNW